MGDWSFRDLNLGGYDTERPGGNRLAVGKHVLKITEAKLRDMSSKNGQQLEVKLEAESGAYVRDFITVHHKTSADAQRIGRQRLKALLTYAGHPNPDNPGDVATMVGLYVGVNVEEEDADIVDRVTGEHKRVKASRPKKNGAYCPVGDDANEPQASAPAPRRPGAPTTKIDLDNEIPF